MGQKNMTLLTNTNPQSASDSIDWSSLELKISPKQVVETGKAK
jgi:hypothetical protein